MKKASKNKFFRIGLLIFIAYLFMNAPFIPKYDFLLGLCTGSGIGLMLFGILDENNKLAKLKKFKKHIIKNI